ncbi:MAG: acetolactate synthase large subunit, partial [Betaproteobacteria bacterium]|nr:acetolactate synthase large subunit [Betaproteobacteria bacterium]
MIGADALTHSLIENGVELCITNPGTSEMHFVSALDRIRGLRCVLGLFEGVVTGAADGYYRLKGKPAATLLHLGPGLGNGIANLHNARKARSGIVNVVGEHALHHIAHDAPLTSDIEGIARPVSHWVRTSKNAGEVGADGAEAIRVSRSKAGQIATLILPADTAWSEGAVPARSAEPEPRTRVEAARIEAAAAMLREPNCLVLLGGVAVREPALALAGKVAGKTGCTLMAEFNNARLERGAGRVDLPRVPYVVEQAIKLLAPYRHVILIGAKTPVAFFGYPDKPSVLLNPQAQVLELATVDDDLLAVLQDLVQACKASQAPLAQVAERSALGQAYGALNPESIAQVLSVCIPEQGIVIDEAVTTGRQFSATTRGALPHCWLNSMGGSIGFGMPNAIGAAIACPDRAVICLEGDGSAMYTEQSLWTMAREQLAITVVIFANRSYAILRGEFNAVGAGLPGQRAIDMLSLDRPVLDWVSIAQGHGLKAERVSEAEAVSYTHLTLPT